MSEICINKRDKYEYEEVYEQINYDPYHMLDEEDEEDEETEKVIVKNYRERNYKNVSDKR